MNGIAPVSPPLLARRRGPADRGIFLAAAIGVAAIVFAGFAPTYYLKVWFGTPPLSLLVHAHGLIMSAWIVLFLTQALLIAKDRAALHRRLGMFGALLAMLVVAVGMIAVFQGAAREVRANSAQAALFLVLLAMDPLILLLFAGFVSAALALRRRSDWHKRLMLLATLCLLLTPVSRLEFLANATAVFLVWDACVIAVPLIDTIRHRRLHPAFAWGVPIVLLSEHLTYLFAQTPAWTQFARWLVT